MGRLVIISRNLDVTNAGLDDRLAFVGNLYSANEFLNEADALTREAKAGADEILAEWDATEANAMTVYTKLKADLKDI